MSIETGLTAIRAAYAILPPRMTSPAATVALLTIGLQESLLTHRRQLVGSPPMPTGPAAGLWQFERGGGVAGVLSHPASRAAAASLCAARDTPATAPAVWEALQRDDVLAAGFARLLLWTDPAPLPKAEAHDALFELYLRTWRPGAYTRGTPAARAGLRTAFLRHHTTALARA